MLRQMGQGQMTAVPMQRLLTEAEKADMKRVERMQVRTQAGVFTCQLMQGRSPTPTEWLEMAAAIEDFIWGQA